MGSKRIAGNKRPRLTIGAPGLEQSADLLSYKFENEAADADAVTFEDAEKGEGRQHYLRGAAVQSTQSSSFWRYVWENSGETEVPYTVAPHGNAVATEDEPHFLGTMTISTIPALGGEASSDPKSSFQFDYEFKLDDKPTMDTGTGA